MLPFVSMLYVLEVCVPSMAKSRWLSRSYDCNKNNMPPFQMLNMKMFMFWPQIQHSHLRRGSMKKVLVQQQRVVGWLCQRKCLVWFAINSREDNWQNNFKWVKIVTVYLWNNRAIVCNQHTTKTPQHKPCCVQHNTRLLFLFSTPPLKPLWLFQTK